MADGTVRGAFELSAEQPIRDLTTIRDRGREADAALSSLGTTMDNLGGPRTIQRLEAVRSKIASVGSASETAATKTETAWARIERTIDDHSTRIEGRLDRLEVKLRDVGRINAKPSVELNGFDRVNAQLTELEARLRRLGSMNAHPRASLGGGFSNIAGGGGGGGGGALSSAGGGAPTLFSAVGGLPTMGLAALGASPGILGLAGGATALVSSAGSAALGAGAVGLGGLAPLAAGGALTYATVRPAVQGLQQIMKAQQALTTATREYGAASSQAATEKRKLDAALLATPAAAGTARQLGLFQADYRRAFAPAQAAFYSGASGVLYNARRALPSLGRMATTATSATANAAVNYSGYLAQPAQLGTIRTLVNAFASELPTVERTLENVTTTMGHLAVAALPFFHEANTWVNTWSAGLARSSGDTVRVRNDMQDMVNSAKDWAHLTGAVFRTLRDIGTAGRPTGDSMVVDLTRTFDKWDQWLQRNPAKVQAWFRQAEDTVGHIANAIGGVVHLIAQVANALTPIFNRAMDFISFVSSLGPGGAPLLYGAYQGVRGAMGGGGPSPGRALGGLLTGSATPFVVGAGAARGAGGTIVGGAAYSSTLSGGAGSRYMMAPAGFQTSTRLPASAIGEQLPLFAALAGGSYVGTRAASSLSAARGEIAFQQAYGGVAGARFAPLEVGGSRAYGLSRLAGPLRGAIGGAARFLGPVAAITGVLQGVQTPGSVQHRINAGLSTAASTLTLGAVSPSSFQHILHSAFGTDNAGSTLTGPAGQSMTALAQTAGSVRTPQQLQTLTEHVRFALGPGSAEFSPADQAKIRRMLTQAVGVAAGNAGAAASNTWQDAFTRGLDSGQRPDRAVATMLSGMGTQIHELGPKGGRAFASDVAVWARQMETDNPKLRRPLQRLMNGIINDLNQLQHHTGSTMKDLRDKIFYYNGQIFTGTDATWGAIRDSLTNKATVAQEKLSGIWAQIQSEAINALKSMGFTGREAQDIVTQTQRGGPFAAAQQSVVGARAAGSSVSQGGAFSPHARGGVIQGRGLLDTVQLPGGAGTAAPGEAWIANRHTMMDLDRASIAMYGKPAWEMIRDETRPHSAPANYRSRGSVAGHLLGGSLAASLAGTGSAVAGAVSSAGGHSAAGRGGGSGYVYPIPGFNVGRTDMGVDASAAPGSPILAMGDSTLTGVIQGWYHGQPLLSFQLNSGPDAGRYWYVAEQISPVTEQIGSHFNAGQVVARFAPSGTGIEIGWGGDAGGRTLAQTTTGYHEGQVTSAGSSFAAFISALSHGQMVPGGPAGGGAAAIRQIGALRAPRSGLAGVPGAMADRASQLLAAGLTRSINSKIGGMSAGGVTPHSGAGSAGTNQTLGHQMMLQQGWGEGQWPSLLALWNQESGWNANAVNPSSGAAGIPQALGHGHPFGLGDAAGQIAWGLQYIRGRYGSPSAAWAHEQSHNWYSTGGPVKWAGWHARGTSAVTNGPTMFGAGEGGRRERVTVTPASTPTHGGGGRSIVVHMEHVHLSAAPEDIERVGREVAGKILDALDSADVGVSDAELVG